MAFTSQRFRRIQPWLTPIPAIFLLAASAEAADQPVNDVISTASVDANSLIHNHQAHLISETTKLEKLTDLQSRGLATWLEVRRQQVVTESLLAAVSAARDYAAFLASLFEQTSHPREQPIIPTTSEWSTSLGHVEFLLATARSESWGERQAAEIVVKRKQLELAAIEELFSKHLASEAERKASQLALQAAESHFERFKVNHESQTHGIHATSSGAEHLRTSIKDLPAQCFARHDFVRWLLTSRLTQCDTTTRAAAYAALAQYYEDRRHALEKSNSNNARTQREVEFASLDRDWSLAKQWAANEALNVQRMAEAIGVVSMAGQPDSWIAPRVEISDVLRSDWPTGSLPLSREGITTHLSAGQQSPLTAAAWQPVAPNWPINNWSATRQVVAPSLPLSGHANVRYSEPSYNEFYAFGNVRLDAPSTSNNFFRTGGLPWYLPGSTTNFK